MTDALKRANRQIQMLDSLKQEYGEERFNKVFDELNANIQFVDMGYALIMVSGVLTVRYGTEKPFLPKMNISNRYKSL